MHDRAGRRGDRGSLCCAQDRFLARSHDDACLRKRCLVRTDQQALEGEWTSGGQSMIVDPTGDMAQELDDAEEGVIAASISRSAVYAARRTKPMLRDRRPDLYTPIRTPTEDIISGE